MFNMNNQLYIVMNKFYTPKYTPKQDRVRAFALL